MKENSKKVFHTNYRSIRVSRLSTDQVGLSNNNPHWNLDFRFLFFPDLIQVLRDFKVTHPSRETWKWLIQVLRDLKVTHQKNQPYPRPWRVSLRWRWSSEDRYTPIVLLVWNTPPSPTFGALLSPTKDLVGKEVFTLEKILPWRRGQLQCDKGIEDRVLSKIWVD